ncbi:MAG TPA: apolipoprotein N-acyltransferase [Stellaceae bacterium]|nr:apolipoprotein N-acyltransferase [Stellaceae bacterium]
MLDAMTAGPAMGLPGFATRLGALQGWRRWLAGIALGLISAGTMPPFNWVPLLLIAIPGLVWLIDGARSRWQAAFDGWRFGFGLFVPSLYWMTLSLFVDIGQFWFLVPFALFGLPALLAAFTAVGTALAKAVPGPGVARVLALAVTWTALEYVRGHVLTGFPWILIAQVWASDGFTGTAWPMLAMAQSVALFGTYGLTAVTMLVAALPACLGYAGSAGRRFLPPLMGLAILALFIGWGAHRLAGGHDPLVPNVMLRLAETDIPQTATWSQNDAIRNLRDISAMTEQVGRDKVNAVIWPESAVGFLINRDPALLQALAPVVPPHGLLITGTLRANPTGPVTQVWNSIAAIDDQGRIQGIYDKFHLVPFGEYVPLRWLLHFNQIVADRQDFSTGPGPQTLDLPGLPPVGAIICYEAIFPHAVVDEAHRPGWIVNVTNDAWFGDSTGPHQHAAIARLRAIEEGLPLARSANGGISAMFDGHGRLVAALPMGHPGVFDSPLPKALPPTLYARCGDWMLVIFLPLLLPAFLRIRRR